MATPVAITAAVVSATLLPRRCGWCLTGTERGMHLQDTPPSIRPTRYQRQAYPPPCGTSNRGLLPGISGLTRTSTVAATTSTGGTSQRDHGK